ncbi:MAG: ATP-binding protein, partial [Kangiellaceae bacterium]|nr:ATP-binding protein [Kangiellaceae bacterium]
QAKQIKFQIGMQRDVSEIYADKELLRIAVNNLLTNAIKYNKQGGQVILTLEETDNDFIISVQDNGIGISAQDQEHIFDKFYRSEDELVRTETGHGLGLSLVKQIVQLHHGLIKIDSSPGEGTEFSIRLEKDMNILQQSLAS